MQREGTGEKGVVQVVANQGKFFGVTDGNIQQTLEGGSIFDTPRVKGMAANGRIHDAIKLGLVLDAAHPAQRLVDSLRTDAGSKADAHAVYSDKAVNKLVVLGFVTGKVWTGKEYDDANAENVTTPLAAMSAFDLNGSLEKNGGWVSDSDPVQANEDMLVLDWSDKASGNEFQHLSWACENPLGDDVEHDDGGGGAAAAGPAGASLREANVAAVELRVDGFPRIAIVTIREVAANDELIIDYGQAQRDIAKRVYKKAKHLAELNKVVNDSQNRIEELQQDVNGYIPRHQKDQQALLSARTAAAILQEAWSKKNKEEGPLFPLHRPGTLDDTVFKKALEKKIDASKLDEETNTLVSKVQTLMFKLESTFRPQCAKEVDGDAVVVENVDDKEYMQLKKEYGKDVGHEIQRAYGEMQAYGNMAVGRNVFPWDSKKKRPLEIDQLVTMVASRIGDAKDWESKIEEEEKTDTKANAALYKRMKYTVINQNELLKHNAGRIEGHGGCQ
jgi:hypothetical protein